jgi:hypothetical protein
MNEQPKAYCPTCGKRLEKPIQTYIHQGENGPIIITYYLADHTEPICNGLRVLQQVMEAMHSRAARPEVPALFQEAFREGELDL